MRLTRDLGGEEGMVQALPENGISKALEIDGGCLIPTTPFGAFESARSQIK
jgi:hypothetical protein